MKVMQYPEFGPPESIQEADRPVPTVGPGQVLIQLAATSVNPADWTLGEGRMKAFVNPPLPFVPGLDFAGIITQTGEGVTGFRAGDAVYGATLLAQSGTYAEYAVVDAGLVAKAPQSIPLTTAAAVPLAALTAWGAVIDPAYAHVRPGQRVLIHGAAGGVGMFAVQLALWRGAHVIATASAGNLDFLRSLGVQQVIDYRETRFEDVVGDLDAVIDLVGGDTYIRSFGVLPSGGKLVTVVPPPRPDLANQHGVTTSLVAGYRSQEALNQISQLIDQGRIRVTVSQVLPLTGAAQALTGSKSRHATGKVVLTMGE